MKNIARTDRGDKTGRIHMKKQNLDEIGGRRMEALRTSRKRSSSDEGAGSAKKAKTQG